MRIHVKSCDGWPALLERAFPGNIQLGTGQLLPQVADRDEGSCAAFRPHDIPGFYEILLHALHTGW